MTRKAKLPVTIPNGVEVTINNKNIQVKGPKGTLSLDIENGVSVRKEENNLFVDNGNNERTNFQGLYHTLVSNLIEGVTKGFSKSLEMIGVGYRAAVAGNLLDLQVGFSHPTKVPIPEGLQVQIEKNTKLTINGTDKQLVGQYAAHIRSIRPPEPYQGKGIRYKDEYVRRKAGKTASAKG